MHLHQADQITADTSTAPQVKPRYKRRVVMLKPLVDTPPMFDKPLKPLRLLRNNSDSSSSPDFSPTSVLPYDKHRHGDLKAGQSQLHQALAASSCYLPADSPPEPSPPAVTPCQQPAITESWTTRHFVYDVKSAAQPAPAPASVRQIPTKASTAVAAPHGPAAQPAKQAFHAKRGTLETAWRWRFKRQWRRVQAQALINDLHDPADDQSDDPWHMAFDMIQAGNAFPDVGVPLPDHDCYSDGPAASPLLDADDDMDGLFEFEHDSAESVGSDHLKPRPALAEAASKARQLIKHQVCDCRVVGVQVPISMVCVTSALLPDQ